MSGDQLLTKEQVLELNFKHGWMQGGDAQGDVSRAFAQDAILQYERIRSHSQELLAALTHAVEIAEDRRGGNWDDVMQYRELINRVSGK